MKAYKVFVFDLDGTLLDTLDDLYHSVNEALRVYGLPLRTREEVRAFVGNGIVKLMERAVGIPNHPNLAEIVAEFKRYYKEHCTDYTKPYEGITPLLQTLKEKGIKTAVVSNKADFAVKMLAKDYFDGLLLAAVGENEEGGVRKKPAPDSLFFVMEALGATAEETVYIGDSETDVATAKNAGVACISVTWGFRDRDLLIESGATTFVDEPKEILAF